MRRGSGETSLTIQGTLTPEGRATCVKSDCSNWVRNSIATAFSMESINFCRRAKHKARPNWIQCLFWKLITNSPLSTNYRSFRWLHLVRLFASFGQLRNLSLNFEARGETSNNLISLQQSCNFQPYLQSICIYIKIIFFFFFLPTYEPDFSPTYKTNILPRSEPTQKPFSYPKNSADPRPTKLFIKVRAKISLATRTKSEPTFSQTR